MSINRILSSMYLLGSKIDILSVNRNLGHESTFGGTNEGKSRKGHCFHHDNQVNGVSRSVLFSSSPVHLRIVLVTIKVLLMQQM